MESSTTFYAVGVAVAVVGATVLYRAFCRRKGRGSRPRGAAASATPQNPFEKAVAIVSGGSLTLTDARKLAFYGLYKQATVGDCNKPKPGLIELVETAKWEAWSALRGMPKIQAQERYCEALEEVSPGWSERAAAGGGADGADGADDGAAAGGGEGSKSGGGGPRVSRMRVAADDDEDGAPAIGSGGGVFDVLKVEDGDAAAFLERFKKDIDQRDDEKRTCLHLAADAGREVLAAALLDAGAAIDAQDADGSTPLHYAVTCDHITVAELLLSRGADISIEDGEGETADAGCQSNDMRALMAIAVTKGQLAKAAR